MAVDPLKRKAQFFWREKELSGEELRLLDELLLAHHRSCFRDNSSSVVVAIAADASGDLFKAIAAGIMTTGMRHAPVEETVRFLSLESPERQVELLLKQEQKVPGWGGTFQKKAIDSLWLDVDTVIGSYYPILYNKLENVTRQLKEHGKSIYPNPSAYTACAAIALGIPAELASYLFIYGRISGWAQIAAKHLIRKAG